MKNMLDKIRKPVHSSISKGFLYSILVMLLGIALGVMAKMLDETASNRLPYFIEILDLRNFFSRMGVWLFGGLCIAIYSKTALRAAVNTFLFFSGMVSSYYIYTIYVAGFFPKAYMMIWIGLTVLSPVIGAVCWYARGTHPVSICISAGILMIISRQAFALGLWYLDVRYVLELLLWGLTIAVLYKTPKQILVVFGAGSLLFFLSSVLNLYWGLL